MNTIRRWLHSSAARPFAVLILLAASCGPGVDTQPPGDIGPPQGACAAVIEKAPDAAALHSPQGTALSWSTNPPAEGTHYPVWAPWAQAYTEVVPRGNWLHNAEHGGVIMLYRCPSGCPEVAAELQAVGNALPQDSGCQQPINARWVLTPDPLLPDGVQVAAVAWGYAYRATCFDRDSLQAFITAHYARGPEDFCSQGALAWH